MAGAEHPLGTALCKRLAGFGATVIAIGQDGVALRDLARTAPSTIEPLALRPGKRNVLTLLHEAWANQPVHIFVDLMALCPPDDSGAAVVRDYGFGHSAGVAAALVGGIRAGRALCTMAVPRASGDPDPEAQARSAGFSALVRRFSTEATPGRFLGLGLPVDSFDWTAARIMSAGDTILMMCHPVSRGLANGSVLEWGAEDGMRLGVVTKGD